MNNYKEELSKIKSFVFDVDGVFSDCRVSLFPSGEMVRTMNIKDGYAIQLAVKKGYPVAIITGGYSKSVKKRFQYLGVKDIYLKSSSKLDDLHHFISRNQLTLEEVLYMGDDIPDLKVMQHVGFPACPADAAEEIKSVSKYISDRNGGSGCVRDIVEQVMKLQGKWLDQDAFYW